MSALLQRLATLAGSLTSAELRILLELAVRAETSATFVITASSRDLARTTGLARASVQAALDSLQRRQLIQSNHRSATQSAAHHLLCFQEEHPLAGPIAQPEVAQRLSQGGLASELGLARFLGQGGLTNKPAVAPIPSQGGPIVEPQVAQPGSRAGLITEPEMAQTLGHGGPTIRPDVAQLLSQDGPDLGPLPNEQSTTCEHRSLERVSACADSIDSEYDLDQIIDRLQKAQKGNFEEGLFEQARQQIASHHARYARVENRLPSLPDDAITAQFLAVAEWPKLAGLLDDLAAERKEAGRSYGWYVTVALQRLRGISPEQLRQTRARRQGSFARELERAAGQHSTPLRVCYGAAVRSAERPRTKGRTSRVEIEQLKEQIRAWAEASAL